MHKMAISLLTIVTMTGCTAAQIEAMNRGLEKQRAQPGYYESMGPGNPYTQNFVDYPVIVDQQFPPLKLILDLISQNLATT
jgi:hypothetical protein